jgi:hypothetical protein
MKSLAIIENMGIYRAVQYYNYSYNLKALREIKDGKSHAEQQENAK